MAVPLFFQTIERSALSTWIRETDSVFGFWFVLSWHAIGMVLLVGTSSIIALRILGVARDLPLAPLKGLYRFIWMGFWIQIMSGGFLLYAYPTKVLTNWDFYLKLALIGIAVYMVHWLKNRVLIDSGSTEPALMAKGKIFAATSLICWVGAIGAGRVLAYTYTYLSYPG